MKLPAAFGRVGRGARRALLWSGIVLASLVVLLVVASFFVDPYLRASIEKRMNRSLKGYEATLPKAHFSLFGFSVTLEGLTIRQKANPEPPVATFPRLRASVHWSEIVRAKVVADFRLDRPRIHLNLSQLRSEAEDDVKVKDRGWQQAFEAIYPLKVNLFRVVDGDVVYIDADPKRPLHLANLDVRASNIRNIRSRDRTYPSPVHVSAVVFEKGRFSADGHADFMAEPYAGVHVAYRAEGIPLEALGPAAGRANLHLEGGVLSSEGKVEWGPRIRNAQVASVVISGLRADLVQRSAAQERETKEKARELKEAGKEVANQPKLVLDLETLRLVDSQLGLVNRTREPGYRVFVDVEELKVTNLTNRQERGVAHATLRGRFLGSGATKASMDFQPVGKQADMALKLAIENTDMRRMNDLLRSYGKFDVTEGRFSFFLELAIKDGRVDGYVKPLFRDMKVYDSRQDEEKSTFRKLYEKIVGGIADLLENRPRDEVATQARVSGRVGSAEMSTWQVVVRLVENAFFRAILPGFDDEVERLGPAARKKPGKK